MESLQAYSEPKKYTYFKNFIRVYIWFGEFKKGD